MYLFSIRQAAAFACAGGTIFFYGGLGNLDYIYYNHTCVLFHIYLFYLFLNFLSRRRNERFMGSKYR